MSIPTLEFKERAVIVPPPADGTRTGPLLIFRRLVLGFRVAAGGIRRADAAGALGGVSTRSLSLDRSLRLRGKPDAMDRRARRLRRRIAMMDHSQGVSRDNESWRLFSETVYDEDIDV